MGSQSSPEPAGGSHDWPEYPVHLEDAYPGRAIPALSPWSGPSVLSAGLDCRAFKGVICWIGHLRWLSVGMGGVPCTHANPTFSGKC